MSTGPDIDSFDLSFAVPFATARFIAVPIILTMYSSMPRIPAKSEVDAFRAYLKIS